MTENENRPGRGYIQVYTGNGKGKTTASLGLALRAAGHGMRTFICQFMKKMSYGELESAAWLKGLVTIEQHGLERFCKPSDPPDAEQLAAARRGWERARAVVEGGEYEVVILDEICTAIWFRLLSLPDVLDLLDRKPPSLELILTGRYAPEEILERADLATEMVEVKHYFASGVQARRGIEY